MLDYMFVACYAMMSLCHLNVTFSVTRLLHLAGAGGAG
jgi:hypothetical protein